VKFVAGTITVRLDGLASIVEHAWRDEFRPFLVEGRPDLRFRYEGNVAQQRVGDLSERFTELDRAQGRALVQGSRWEAHLDVSTGEVHVRTAGEWPQEVRVLLSPAAQARAVWLGKAVPLHGAAFVLDGKAVALIGESGAGKTTCARFALSRGCDLLAEELVWVGGVEEALPAVHMLPFAERHSLVKPRPLVAPLAAVFVLQQGSDDAIVDLPVAERLRALWRRTSIGFKLTEVAARGFRLDSALESLVPVMGLRFTRSDRFVDVIADWLRSGERSDPVQSTPQAMLDDGEDS
jgi:hypothetical protein